MKYDTYCRVKRNTVATPRTTDECARRTSILDVHCTTTLFIDQRETKKEAERLFIQNECQKTYSMKKINGKKNCFLI